MPVRTSKAFRQTSRRRGPAAGAAAFGLSALMALSLAACNRQAGAAGAAMAAPDVGVVEITPQAYEQTVRLSGRVSAFLVSEVRPQIGGIVRTRRFTEGAQVRAGQVLYEIDPGPAQAELSGAQAAAASARARYERYLQLVEIGAISRQDLEDARASADQTAAALDAARISVRYTQVPAPISGVIGASSVTPGALAVPNQAEPFATIQQIDRVYVDMTQSSAALLQWRQAMSERDVDRAKVRLKLQDGSYYAHDGELQFSDISVSESTGTVQLRALFPNPDRLLLPGMFVQAELSVGTDPDAILVPQQGVSRNARGEAVVLVLNPQNVVEERVIETAATAGDKWLVTAGLSPGERVIVEGVQRVRPGAPATAAAPTQAPAQTQPAQAAPQQPAPVEGGELRGREG